MIAIPDAINHADWQSEWGRDRPSLTFTCKLLALLLVPTLAIALFDRDYGWSIYVVLFGYVIFLWLARGIAAADRLYGRPEASR